MSDQLADAADPVPNNESIWSKPPLIESATCDVSQVPSAPSPSISRGQRQRQSLPPLVLSGVVLLVIGSAVSGHLRTRKQRERSDSLATVVRSARQEVTELKADLSERRKRDLQKRQIQALGLTRALKQLRGKEEKTSQLAVGLLDKLIAVEAWLKARSGADVAINRQLAALEKRQQALVSADDFQTKWAWTRKHLARRSEVQHLSRRIETLRVALAADAEQLSGMRESLPSMRKALRQAMMAKADKSALEALARKSELRSLASKKMLEGVAHMSDLEGLVDQKELGGLARKSVIVGLAQKSELTRLEATLRILAKGIQHMLTTLQKNEQRLKLLRADVEQLKQKLK